MEVLKEKSSLIPPVPLPHTIPYSPPYPTFLAQVSNPYDDISLVSDHGGSVAKNDGATETFQWDEGGKYPSSTVGGIEERITLKSLD